MMMMMVMVVVVLMMIRHQHHSILQRLPSIKPTLVQQCFLGYIESPVSPLSLVLDLDLCRLMKPGPCKSTILKPRPKYSYV